MKNKSSIHDVAREAGVSIATISRTFQYPDRVAKKTRDLVMDVAESLNYMPNAQARSLRTAQTRLIVALVPDIANPFFSEVIRGVEQIAKQHGYAVLLGDTQYEIENEQRYADMLSSRQVDGILTLLPRVPDVRFDGRLPIVNACEPVDDPTISSVAIDNAAAFRNGVDYLITLGHRHIAFISGPPSGPLNIARRAGFDAAMAAAGLPVVPQFCQEGDFSMEAGARAAGVILSYGLPVTAFACASDQLAVGAMHALRSRGLSVPQDVSVLGFDDIAVARFTNPPHTTIAQPRDEMGREAMLMLLQLLKDDSVPARKIILPTQLVVRGSTAKPTRSTGTRPVS
jgi:LacI family repressor for deo operon, udp, cdd, tsx, nupC, and nupG